jgi:hypothetical protein
MQWVIAEGIAMYGVEKLLKLRRNISPALSPDTGRGGKRIGDSLSKTMQELPIRIIAPVTIVRHTLGAAGESLPHPSLLLIIYKNCLTWIAI